MIVEIRFTKTLGRRRVGPVVAQVAVLLPMDANAAAVGLILTVQRHNAGRVKRPFRATSHRQVPIAQ